MRRRLRYVATLELGWCPRSQALPCGGTKANVRHIGKPETRSWAIAADSKSGILLAFTQAPIVDQSGHEI